MNQVYNITVDWDAGFAKLLSTTSYDAFDPHFTWDCSPIDGSLLTTIFGRPLGLAVEERRPAHSWTQELRLSSESDQPLQWQIGGFFTREVSNSHTALTPIDVTTKELLSNFAPGATPLDSASCGTYSTYREYAGFANLDYRVTPAVDVAVGGRYSRNEQTLNQSPSVSFLGPQPAESGASSEGVFTYSGDIRWHVDSRNMLYARIASGYVPGGPNALLPSQLIGGADVPKSYNSSTTVNYEAGVKSTLLDGRLTAEVSLFDIEWRDIQIVALFNGLSVATNGGQARSDGIEWNFAYVPIPGLTLNLNGAYTNAHLTQTSPAGVGGQSGDPLPSVSLWASSASMEYERPLFNDYTGFASVNWQYMDSRYADFEPSGPRQEMPSYNIFNLRAGVERQNWSVALYVKNLTNKLAINYVQDKSPNGGFGEQSAAVYIPRTIGVTVGVKF